MWVLTKLVSLLLMESRHYLKYVCSRKLKVMGARVVAVGGLWPSCLQVLFL